MRDWERAESREQKEKMMYASRSMTSWDSRRCLANCSLLALPYRKGSGGRSESSWCLKDVACIFWRLCSALYFICSPKLSHMKRKQRLPPPSHHCSIGRVLLSSVLYLDTRLQALMAKGVTASVSCVSKISLAVHSCCCGTWWWGGRWRTGKASLAGTCPLSQG